MVALIQDDINKTPPVIENSSHQKQPSFLTNNTITEIEQKRRTPSTTNFSSPSTTANFTTSAIIEKSSSSTATTIANNSIFSPPIIEKLIFLDADGVLNTCYTPIPEDGFPLEEALVNRVVKLCIETNAKLCICSTWRKEIQALEKLTTAFTNKGIEVLGSTPILHKPYFRSLEILEWLKTRKVLNWIIIDDDIELFQTKFDKVSNHLVLTDDEQGFTEYDFAFALQKLTS